jgi:hypothetical protein
MEYLSHVWKKYLEPLVVPWQIVHEKPFHFAAWVLVVPGVGMDGFWLPMILAWVRGETVEPLFLRLLSAGTTASVCVAILAEGLLSVLTAEKAGSNVPALGLRGVAGGLGTLLIILLVGVMGADSASVLSGGPRVSSTFHLVLMGIALFVASYLYCFRSPTWESAVHDVDEAVAKEESEIVGLSSKAKQQNAEGEVKL